MTTRSRWATHTAYPEVRIPETPMPKWTPPPWRFYETELHFGIAREGTGGRVAYVAIAPQSSAADEGRANAVLIASVHNLYAALGELVRACEAPALLKEDLVADAIVRAKAALAKARGES